MKVRYLGISDPLELLNGKVYDVISIEGESLQHSVVGLPVEMM